MKHLAVVRLLTVLAAVLPGLSAQEQAAATVQLSGRVVSWQGEAIAGAAVAFATREQWTTAQFLAEATVRTGADGRFTLAVPAAVGADDLSPPTLLVAAKGMAAIAPSVPWKMRPLAPGNEIRWRADTDAGDLVMPEGARLFGRVRDSDGKGIAGVAVTIRDLLDGQRVFAGTQSAVHCRAVSNASGIFELPAALAHGVVVEFAAKGYLRQTLHGVGAGAPLEVTLQPSPGRVAGRVVDQGGAPVAGAHVRVVYERAGNTTRVRTGADGGFELPIEQPGRFRVSAARPRVAVVGRRQAGETAESAVLRAPVASLELTLQLPQGAAGVGTLKVQAVEAASGKPVAGFRAVAIWQPFAMQNAAYLDYLATMWLQSSPVAEGNEIAVKGPTEDEARTGAVRVLAPGFAPTTERDVEWAEAEADRKTVVVKLVKEATVRGSVVDERTGAAIAGARVWAQRKQDRSQGTFGIATEVPDTAVTTAADGAFVLDQLGEGDWTVRWRHPDRPAPTSVDVALKPEEQQTGLQLKLAAGARVAGRITGLPIPPGSKVVLQPVPTPCVNAGNYYTTSSSQLRNELKAPLAADGTFALTGIALANFFLLVELPLPPRGGGPLYLPIEPLRVRPDGVQRDFDAGLDLPSRIRGTLRFPHEAPAGAVVVVVAEQLADESDDQQQATVSSGQQFSGPRAFVKADGSFVLPVVSGSHRLRVVDASTGVLLATAPQRLRAPVGGEVTTEVAVPLTEVTVQLQADAADGGPLAHVDRLEVRHVPNTKDDRNVILAGNSDQYDAGVGLPVEVGTTSLRLWLPEGKVTLFARGSAYNLMRSRNRNMAPLAKEELDLTADQKARTVVLRVGAAPELDDEPKPKDAAAPEKR